MSLRPESSVSLFLNEWGELVCDADRQGPVIHRTPEELGIPAVTVDVPRVPSWFKPSTDTGPGSAGRSKQDRRRKFALPTMKHNRASALKSVTHINPLHAAAAKVQEAQLRTIGGEPVLMPAGATMGAELLEGFIAERRKEKERAMPKNNGRVPDEIRLKILAELPSVSNGEISRKYDVAEGTVWYIRNKAGIHSTAKPGFRKGTQERHAVAVIPRAASTARSVEIEPQRPGTAAALVNALAKIDADQAQLKVEIQLTQAEVARVIEGLDPAQRVAFLNAGLRAALLA